MQTVISKFVIQDGTSWPATVSRHPSHRTPISIQFDGQVPSAWTLTEAKELRTALKYFIKQIESRK